MIALHTREVSCNSRVRPVRDPAAWQQWRFEPAEKFSRLKLVAGEEYFFDFGEQLVGTPSLTFECGEFVDYDAPVRLRLRLGELPAETVLGLNHFTGTLSRAWYQEEFLVLDLLNRSVTLPRRYAFRYLAIRVEDANRPFYLTRLTAEHTTAAGECLPAKIADPELAQIDRVAVKTLENCMQNVFEDGPKRDRRLWLGDLRLQAMVNAVTFRNFDLVEHSLRLLAARTGQDGWFPACVFDREPPCPGNVIMDYSLLLGPTLREHCEFSGRTGIAEELFELSLRQLELVRPAFDDEGVFRDPGGIWLFLDHQPELNRESGMQCVYIFSLKEHAKLARMLNREPLARELESEAGKLTAALREHRYDRTSGLILSGPENQRSYATTAWAIIAGVLDATEGRRALQAISDDDRAVKPVTPYLWHCVLESCFRCGDTAAGIRLIRGYWGEMIRRGADTFWEAFVPDDPEFSPYHDFRLNSACHAWSCTPAYFIRKYLATP